MLSLFLIMQIISCDCQPNCNCLVTCNCDTNLLLSCAQTDQPKFDLISAYSPDAQPTVNTPVIKPTVNTPVIKPTVNTSDIKPTINTSDIKPTINTSDIKPTINTSRKTTYYPAKPSNTKSYVRPTTRRTTTSISSSSCNT